MADPLTLLAAPVEPVAPDLPATAQPVLDALWLLVPWLALALGVAALVWTWWWWRRWPRALRQVRPGPSAAETADRLARLVRQHARLAPPAWWAELDAIRFGRPDARHGDALERLLLQAEDFVAAARRAGSPASLPWRRAP